MSDEEEFLENGESVASAIPQRMRKNKPQAHFLVCRNPEFETPGPNRGRRPPPMTPGLANALRMAKHFQENKATATPLRGPSRFLRVIDPEITLTDDESLNDGQDDQEIEDSITNTPRLLEHHHQNKLKNKTAKPVTVVQSVSPMQRIPFSPIAHAVANSPNRKRLTPADNSVLQKRPNKSSLINEEINENNTRPNLFIAKTNKITEKNLLSPAKTPLAATNDTEELHDTPPSGKAITPTKKTWPISTPRTRSASLREAISNTTMTRSRTKSTTPKKVTASLASLTKSRTKSAATPIQVASLPLAPPPPPPTYDTTPKTTTKNTSIRNISNLEDVSIVRRSRARKKLSVATKSVPKSPVVAATADASENNIEPTPSEACQEVSQPSIPANEEIPSTSTAEKNVAYEFNSPFRDSPFFKVPLPPQPIKKAFTLRKFVASSNLRQTDKSSEVSKNIRLEPIEKSQRVTPLYSFHDSPDNVQEDFLEEEEETAPSTKKRIPGRSVVEEPEFEMLPPKAKGRGRPKTIVEFAAEEEAPANQTSVRKRKKSNSRSSAKEDKISPPKKKIKGKKPPAQIEVENDDDESDHQIPNLDDSPPKAVKSLIALPTPTVPSKKIPKVNKKPPPKIVVEDEESDNQAEATIEHIPEPLGNQLAKNDEPSDNIEDYRFLVNWVPKLKGKKMIVEGDLYDFTRMDNPNHYKDRWVSSKITERLKNNLVKTAKGTTYCLEGAMHSGLCRHYNTPQFIIMAFRNGFPEQWDVYRKQWRMFNLSQRNLDDVSSIAGSLASVSSVSVLTEKSGFVGGLNEKSAFVAALNDRSGFVGAPRLSSTGISSATILSRIPSTSTSLNTVAEENESEEEIVNDKQPAAKPVASSVVKKKVVDKKPTAAPKKSKAPPKPKPPPKKKQQPQIQKVSEKNLKYAAFKRPTTTQDESEEEEEGPSAKTKKKATVVPEKKQKRVSEKSLKYAAFKKPALENNDTKAAKHNNDVFETSDIVGPDQDDSSDNEYEPTSPAAKKNKKATKKNTPKKVVAKSSNKKTPVRRVTKAKRSPFAKKTKTKKVTPKKDLHPAKKYACTMCSKSYTQSHSLKSHVQKVHKKVVEEVQNAPEPMPSTSKHNDKKVDEQKKKKKLLPPPPNPKPTKKISRKKSLDDVRHVSQLEDLQSFTTKNRKKSIHSSSYVNTSNMLGISQLKSKPKTITDMMNNDKILREYNTNHQDNLFKKTNKQKTSEKSKQHQTTASAIRTELFDSDSEQDVSLMSSRTPITAFFNRSRTLDDNNDADADDENEVNPQNYQKSNAEPGFQEQAFIARQLKDKRRTHRLMKTVQHTPLVITESPNVKKKKIEKATAAISRFSQELIRENDPDDSDDGTDYFTDIDATTSSINNPPSGILSMLGKTK